MGELLYIYNKSIQIITIGVSPSILSTIIPEGGQITIQPNTTFSIESDRVNIGQLYN